MHINWSGLGEVFGIGLGATVVVVALFSLGIVALGRRAAIVERDDGGSVTAPVLAAVLCFLACVAVVGYGIYLIVAK